MFRWNFGQNNSRSHFFYIDANVSRYSKLIIHRDTMRCFVIVFHVFGIVIVFSFFIQFYLVCIASHQAKRVFLCYKFFHVSSLVVFQLTHKNCLSNDFHKAKCQVLCSIRKSCVNWSTIVFICSFLLRVFFSSF